MLKPLSSLYEDFESYECYENVLLSSSAELPEIEEKIKVVVEEQAKSFRELAPGVLEISLADYIEELAK
jgi:hypothetical protein